MGRAFALFAIMLSLALLWSGCASKAPLPDQRQITRQKQPSAFLPTVPMIGKKVQIPSITQPEITIGLTADTLPHKISSLAGFMIVRKTGSLVLFDSHPGQFVTILSKINSQNNTPPLFSVQVGSYKTEAGAKPDLAIVQRELKTSAKIFRNEYDHFFRIKFPPLAKDIANTLGERCASLGMTNIRIVALPKNETAEAIFIRIMDDEGTKVADIAERLIIFPREEGSFIELDGNPYRGNLEIFLNANKKMTIINRLNLEDYLKGVVPGEMSGHIFPVLEALKAQAVAARTYAVRNLGQFAKAGYDLCASPLCQVYKGVSAEQEITSRAVDETSGVVATYNGRLINALYTSTCGGHTESSQNVFPQMNEPYLKGVTCYPENTGHGVLLLTDKIPVYYADDFSPINKEAALLESIGFLNNTLSLSKNIVTENGLRSWLERLKRFLYKKENIISSSQNNLTRLDVSLRLLALFIWEKRVKMFIDAKDAVNLAQYSDYLSFPKNRLREITYLLREEIISPFPDNSLHLNRPMNYHSLARMVFQFMKSYKMITIKAAIFVKYHEGKIHLIENRLPAEYPVTSKPRLFYNISDRIIQAEKLLIRPGDKIKFVTDHLGMVKYIELDSHRKGLSDDRFSSLYFWQQTYKAEELAAQINQRVKVGRIIDIKPLEFGVSGRVSKLKITGSKGSAVLQGLEIRRVLGIKENLFIIEKRNDSKGKTAYYYFVGKGWGHGVGMCQFGAYGRALRGETYDQILQHYYTGIKLKKISAN